VLGPDAAQPTQTHATFFAPAYYGDAAFEKDYNEVKYLLGTPIDKDGRAFVAKYIRTIDRNYAAYAVWLSSGRASIDVTYDSVGLATTGLSAISNVLAVKTGLAAIGTFAQGQKQSIDKNYYQGKVIFTLINVMEVSRTDIRGRLRRALQDDKYTVQQALFDLEEYYKAGTIDTALTAASVNTGTVPATPQSPASAAAPEAASAAGSAASAAAGAASAANETAHAAKAHAALLTELMRSPASATQKNQLAAAVASADKVATQASAAASSASRDASRAQTAATAASAAAVQGRAPVPGEATRRAPYPSTSLY
jgi:hypothetical protein